MAADETQKPTTLFFIDRVRHEHLDSRPWLVLNTAAAWHHGGGRALLLIDSQKKSHPEADPQAGNHEKIVEIAAEHGLQEHFMLPIGRKQAELWKPGYWKAVRKLARTIEREEIDAVQVYRRSHHIASILAERLVKRNIAILRCCARSNRNLNHGLTQRLLFPWIHGVTGFSKTMVRTSQEMPGIDPAICHELPPPLPRTFTEDPVGYEAGRERISELFGLEGLSSRQVVGLIGAVSPYKCSENAIMAAARLRERFPRLLLLLVVGQHTPENIKPVQKRITKMGLQDTVKMIISNVGPDIPAILAGLDVGLYIARESSGPSRLVLEYLSQGTPVVATDVGVVPEYHQRDPHAFTLIPKNDVDALVAAIGDFLENPEQARKTGQRGAALIRKDFTLEAAAGRLDAIYASALEKRNS